MERRPILLKLEGLPLDTSIKDINKFFKDPNLSQEDVSILRNDSLKCVGIAYVRFSSKNDFNFACRHSSNSIHGSHVTFKETSMSEMVSTRTKIEGGSSSMDRRTPRATHPPFNSRLSDSRERDEARRLPFSRFTSAPLDGPGRVHSRSRSPPSHRPEVRRAGFGDHRPGDSHRHGPAERHDTRRPRVAHSPPPPRDAFQGREDLTARVRSPPQRRRVEEDNHVFNRLSDTREEPSRRTERVGQHHREGPLSEDEFARRGRAVDSEPQLLEERRVGRSAAVAEQQSSDGRAPSASRGVVPPSASRLKRPVPTSVAKMYELKVMGYPPFFKYRDIRLALGRSVSVTHNGIDLDEAAHRPTAYVEVLGESSYDAALERDGFQLDRHHTLTVLPANRAKDAASGGDKAPEDDLRDVLVKKRHQEGGKQQVRSPSPRPSSVSASKKVSSSAIVSSRRRGDEEDNNNNGHRRMEDVRPTRRDEDVGPRRDRSTTSGHRREEDGRQRGDLRPRRDDSAGRKTRESDRVRDERRDREDERRGREKEEHREAERRERREKELALDRQRNMRLEEPGYIEKLWNSMDSEPPPKVRSPVRSSPDRYRRQRPSYDRSDPPRPHPHSQADSKRYVDSTTPEPHSRSDLDPLGWNDSNSHNKDVRHSQSSLTKPDSEDFIPLSRQSFHSPEPAPTAGTSALDMPPDPLYRASDADSFADRSQQLLGHPYLPPPPVPVSLGYGASQFLPSPLQINQYLYQQQQQQQQAVLEYSAQQQGLIRAAAVAGTLGPGSVAAADHRHSPVSLLATGGVAPGMLATQQHKVGGAVLRHPGVGYTSQALVRSSPYSATTTTLQGKVPVVGGGKLSSVVHIVNKAGQRPSPSVVPAASLLPKAGTVISSGSSALTLTQLGLGAGVGPGGHHMLRITGAPASTTIQDVIGFLLDHTVSFNDVRIQCTDLGRPTGKVFVTYRSYTQASDKVKALAGSLLKHTKVALDVV